MQFFADIIDQLDLALDQLAVKDRNFDRFALMLIDNALELMLHRFVRDKANENEFWGKMDKPKYDPQHIHEGLSQKFTEKAKFACTYKLIDQEVYASILNLHSLRNTAYHQGQRHERILHSAASFYFVITCKVCQTYNPHGWYLSSGDKYSHRARKYLGSPRFLQADKCVKSAFLRLEEVVNTMEWNIVSDLVNDTEYTINEINRMIDFLAKNAPQKSSRNQVIVECQAWPFAFTDEAKAFAAKNGCAAETVGQYIEWIKDNYPWKIKADPIPSWKRRFSSIKNEKSKHAALAKYSDFIKQTQEIRDNISEAAAQLGAYIDQLIDERRGN
jgi:hypothetical protein